MEGMGTKTLVPVEEYLRTSYEPSREYVRGELVERGLPSDSHSKVQSEVIRFAPADIFC
jgi:hypothetical protein